MIPRPPPNDRRQQNPTFRTNNVEEIQQEIEAIAPLHQQTPSYPAIRSRTTGFSIAGSIQLVPLTSRQPQQQCGSISELNTMPHKTQPVVAPPLDFRTSNALLTSIARIENNAVPVLFDGGSQVNTISATMALKFNLQITPLTKQRRILFPNGQSTQITHYVERLVITFPALASQ